MPTDFLVDQSSEAPLTVPPVQASLVFTCVLYSAVAIDAQAAQRVEADLDTMALVEQEPVAG